jgi:hypothetical protein
VLQAFPNTKIDPESAINRILEIEATKPFNEAEHE